MRLLQRSDIVGRKISKVWQSPWQRMDEINVCSVFVELDNGVCFELQCQDPFKEFPIPQVDPSKMTVVPAEVGRFGGTQDCWIGDTIAEVVACRRWPSFGLLLLNSGFLLVSDWGPTVVGAVLSPVGVQYRLSDVATYWGAEPVTDKTHKRGKGFYILSRLLRRA